MSIAIVTGASSGIGMEFCRYLDNLGLDSIWLVARRKELLSSLASELKTDCRVLTADLTDNSSIASLLNELEVEKPRISYLVNCAGFGSFGSTSEQSLDEINRMISLNCTALIDVTVGTFPYMAENSSIIEVCSASAYLPLYRLNIYSATKAMVHTFCQGFRQETEEDKRNIKVLEVSPGWVSTDFISKSTSECPVSKKVFKRTVTKEDVVSNAFSDLSKGKKVSICGGYNKLLVFMCKHFPRISTFVWKRSLV